MSANDRLRVGIAGLGRMGSRHARNLATRVPNVHLVAACSPSADERAWARDLRVPQTCATYAELLHRPGLDAVFLATPTSEHPGQLIAALDAGKHVFSEKPISLQLEDCRRVEEAAARSPRLNSMIDYMRRFDVSYRDAYDKIARGLIGVPFIVRSQPPIRTTHRGSS
jgi:myo-inositol 2-dehydrogenase/D-chiro-inositol 1-dehydrogenase